MLFSLSSLRVMSLASLSAPQSPLFEMPTIGGAGLWSILRKSRTGVGTPVRVLENSLLGQVVWAWDKS